MSRRVTGGVTGRVTGVVSVVAVACWGLAACTGTGDPDTRSRPASTGAPAPSTAPSTGSSSSPGAPGAGSGPAPGQPGTGGPATPALGRPARLAEQLLSLHRGGRIRAAAHFQQLTARGLAALPPRTTHRVAALLPSGLAAKLRGDVDAARRLGALTSAQPKLPDWRIVRPPPAGELLGHYREAESASGVPWEYLAAIHLVETRMGRIRGISVAGARGPMQFLPSTWAAYGGGGDIDDARDAILAAARLLRANGAPDDLSGALWSYNHSDAYVRAVTGYARAMARDPAAYHGYWHWRVLYKSVRGNYLLPVGYPRRAARLLD